MKPRTVFFTGLIAAVIVLYGLSVVADAGPHETLQEKRWASASVAKHRQHEVDVIADRVIKHKARYDAVAARSGVPWHVIAGLHNMEASGAFTKHLHEGSPLTARTRWVPKGRPTTGSPPFTWEASAIDALGYDAMGSKNWRILGDALSACEGYNGWGYKKFHPSTPTPYLWAGTSTERPGKYVADGKWSPTARSSQIGVAAIWKVLQSRGTATIPKPTSQP